MNCARQVVAIVVLSITAAGCRHTPAQPLPSSQAPSIKSVPVAVPPSGNPLSTQSELPLPSLPPADEDAAKHAPKPPPKPKHHRKVKVVPTPVSADDTSAPATVTPGVSAPATPAPTSATPLTADSTTQASNPSPIGQLSAGDVSAGAKTRRDTVDLISSTETRLTNISRLLTVQDQTTAGQIRSFLQKAKTALEVDDMDGARTLATKAKVLLDELIKQ